MKYLSGDIPTLLGIAHECYVNECIIKGLSIDKIIDNSSKYNCELVELSDGRMYLKVDGVHEKYLPVREYSFLDENLQPYVGPEQIPYTVMDTPEDMSIFDVGGG